jgi:hypothetical protein
MDDKIEINILDIRSNLIDLRTISEEDIKSLFPGNFWPNIYLTRRYKSILFNFAKKSNIESINMRNILVFPGVIPDISNAHAKPVKLMTIKPVITQHGKFLYLPENTDIAVTSLNLKSLDVNINMFYKYDNYSRQLDVLFDKMAEFKFGTTLTKTKIVDDLVEIFKPIIYFYLSNVFEFITAADRPQEFEPFDHPLPVELPIDRPQREIEKLAFMVKSLYDVDIKSAIQGIATLSKYGEFEEYYYILTDGTESEKFKEYLKDVNMEKARKNQYAKLAATRVAEQNKLNKYLSIIERKLEPRKIKYSTLAEILASLSKNERKLVETEYEAVENEWKLAMKNTCTHVAMIRKLYRATERDLKALLLQIKPLLVEVKGDKYLCKLCNFSIICPHKFERYLSIVEKWPYERYHAAMQKYIIAIGERYAYFCHICSEELMKIEPDYKSDIDSEDDIKIFIWSSAMQALEIFTFVVIQSTRKIAQNAIPVVFGKISKQKFTNENERKLAAAVYTYAFILDLYIESKNLVIQGATKINLVADKLLAHFLGKNFIIIRNIVNFSPDEVAKQFLSAYKEIRGTNIKLERDPTKELIEKIITSTDYHFAYIMAKLDNKLTGDQKRDFEFILGQNLDSYKQMYKNDQLNNLLNGKIKYNESLIYTLREFDLLPESQYYQSDNDKKSKLYDAFKIHNFLMKNVCSKTTYDEYLEMIKKHQLEYPKRILLYNMWAIDMDNHRFSINKLPYSNIYDELGIKHKWDIYIYGDKKIKKSDLLPLEKAILTDMECAVCGVKKSSTSELSDEKIRKLLYVNATIKAFYAEYYTKCPEGGLHSGDPCKKCKIDKSKIDFAYYEKYKKERDSDYKITTFEKFVPRELKWEFNYTNIIKVAEMCKIQPEQILILGLTGGKIYKKMIKKPEYEPLIARDHRLFLVAAYVRQIIIEQHKSIVNLSIVGGGQNKLDSCELAINTLSPDLALKFLQEMLCIAILDIENKELAVKLMLDVVENSKLIAKNEYTAIIGKIDTETIDDQELEDFDKEVEDMDDQNGIEELGDHGETE